MYGYYKKPSYVNTIRKGDTLSARSKTLGLYTLATDTIAPKIKPVNFTNKKWLSKYRYLKLKISDDLSGISKYRATVNGRWILMEYDPKNELLVYNFDNNIGKGPSNFRLEVIDNSDNFSNYECSFIN